MIVVLMNTLDWCKILPLNLQIGQKQSQEERMLPRSASLQSAGRSCGLPG